MSNTGDIKKAVKQLADKGDEVYSILCRVDSVDLTAKTCYCLPLDGGADISDVSLICDAKTGFMIIPTLQSIVMVTMQNKSTGFIGMFSQVDFIHLNGTSFGGLIKIDNLKSQYDTNFTNLKSAIVAALAPLDAVMIALGMPAPLATQIFNTSVTGVTALNKTALENTTVLHGDGN